MAQRHEAATAEESARIVDSTSTGWNACSLEVLRPPYHDTATTTGAASPGDGDEQEAEREVPLVIGCYELLEQSPAAGDDSGNGEGCDDDGAEREDGGERTGNDGRGRRRGRLRLYLIDPTPDGDPNKASFEAAGRRPVAITEMEGGVLDGKWMPMRAMSRSTNSAAAARSGSRWYEGSIFASACSTGRIRLHELGESSGSGRAARARLVPVAASSLPDSVDSAESAICLSLDWDVDTNQEGGGEAGGGSAPPATARIVSSYSNGQLAIHDVDVTGLSSSSPSSPMLTGGIGDEDGGKHDSALREVFRWDAHAAFGVPSEVWTCCWASPAAAPGMGSGGNHLADCVLSGADDCKLKLWDLRSLSSPVFCVGTEGHDAGVTAVSWHPTNERVFASGCYDGVVRLWDVRRLTSTTKGRGGRGCQPVARSQPCGGGIWRIRWHPHDGDVMLVGAMHGGCHVLKVDDLRWPSSTQEEDVEGGASSDAVGASLEAVSSFTAHESMAYGADWLHCPPTSRDDDLAASCSFYDRRAFVWNAG